MRKYLQDVLNRPESTLVFRGVFLKVFSWLASIAILVFFVILAFRLKLVFFARSAVDFFRGRNHLLRIDFSV